MKRLIHKDLSSLIRNTVIDEYNYRGVDSQIRQLQLQNEVIRAETDKAIADANSKLIAEIRKDNSESSTKKTMLRMSKDITETMKTFKGMKDTMEAESETISLKVK